MKILFLLPADGLGGGFFVAYEHARRLQWSGHKVEIGFRDQTQYYETSSKSGYSDLTFVSWTDAIDNQYDIAIATWWETAFDLLKIDAQAHAYFVQSDERRFYPPQAELQRQGVESTYRLPLAVITEARWLQSLFQEEFGRSVALAPNGIDREVFHPAEALEARKPGCLRVLIEGPGTVSYKRVGVSFSVLQNLDGIEIWHIATDNVTEVGWVADRFFGPQEQSQMKYIYSSCDVLLKLSVVEGFFAPPLEMMACGGTAVVARVTGWDEYIRDRENALVVDLDDVDAARRAIVELRDNPALLQRLKSAGPDTAARFPWDHSSQCFENFLLETFQRARKSSRSMEESVRE